MNFRSRRRKCPPMSVVSKESAQRVNWSRQSSVTPTAIGPAQTIGIASIEGSVRGRGILHLHHSGRRVDALMWKHDFHGAAPLFGEEA